MTESTTNSKPRIAVLFGGRSAEHDVSVLSATNVVPAIDPRKYDVLPIFVTKNGEWLLSAFENGALLKPERGTSVSLVPGGKGRMLTIPADGGACGELQIDLLFPVLHGLYGEDGSVQGLAEVARVPLVGCGILGSATAIDKDITKRLLNEAGVPNARSVVIHPGTVPGFADLKEKLGLPIFVKPARQGSSVGVSKINDAAGYDAAIAEGFKHDRKLIAEEFIQGREIEFSVLEKANGELFVSRPGEIVSASTHAFYSYDAKYIDADGAVLKVPAELPADVEEAMRAMAAKAFTAIGCDSMARVDFFLKPDMRFLINEINTIPGFTNISMYSKAMEASGISYAGIMELLLEHALARAAR